MDMSAIGDIPTHSVRSLPSADQWTDGFVAHNTTLKNDVFYCLSDSSVVQRGFTNDATCTAESSSSPLLNRLRSDTVTSSSCHGALTVSVPYCWTSSVSGGQMTTCSSSRSCSECILSSTDYISHCHPMTTVTAVDRNSSSTLNGMQYSHCY